MQPLISVIVPVYKVEPYLHKCVDSILNQTYRNLEVILVDDGSPDNCGAICDAYAAEDSRVKVIHKANGGLSSARNAGIAAASGEYLSFVDSDDWLSCDLFSRCMQIHPFDIAIFGMTLIYEGSPESKTIPACDKSRGICLDHEESVLLNLVSTSLFGYTCNKIYSRNALDGVQFPCIALREDLVANLSILEKAQELKLIDCNGYYYLQRSDSLLHGGYYGEVPDISSITRKLIVRNNKLSNKTNQAITNILVRNHIIDSLYRYVFKNQALSDNNRLTEIRKIFFDREIVNTLCFSLSDGPLAALLFFCAKLQWARLFLFIMKRKWYV